MTLAIILKEKSQNVLSESLRIKMYKLHYSEVRGDFFMTAYGANTSCSEVKYMYILKGEQWTKNIENV